MNLKYLLNVPFAPEYVKESFHQIKEFEKIIPRNDSKEEEETFLKAFYAMLNQEEEKE